MDTDRAQSDDGWLEQALKADAQGTAYVADDAFTAGVMARLPHSATLPAWRRPVLALLWLIAGGAVVALVPDLFYTLFQGLVALFVAQPLTWSNLVLALLLLTGTTWSALVYVMRTE
jgi:hypothetical protein